MPKSPYKARLTAQAQAVKALSTEKAPTKSFSSLSLLDQQNRLVNLFETAANQTVKFFQLYLEHLGTNARMSPNLPNGKQNGDIQERFLYLTNIYVLVRA